MTDQTKICDIFVRKAIGSYRDSDYSRWHSALFCSRVVGKYSVETKILADEMGVSSDTIEGMAHAYAMFEMLCKFNNGTARWFVFQARRTPYVFISHFRSLYTVMKKYNLSLEQILDLLMEVVQAEGAMSSRDVSEFARSRYGAEVTWAYEAYKIGKKLTKFVQIPDLPNDGRKKAQDLSEWIEENTQCTE